VSSHCPRYHPDEPGVLQFLGGGKYNIIARCCHEPMYGIWQFLSRASYIILYRFLKVVGRILLRRSCYPTSISMVHYSSVSSETHIRVCYTSHYLKELAYESISLRYLMSVEQHTESELVLLGEDYLVIPALSSQISSMKNYNSSCI
jgi:hypothetical protein